MRQCHIVFSTLAFLGTLCFIPPSFSNEEWIQIRSGKAYGISGIAWIERHQEAMKFLVVHDNKADYPERLAIVSIPRQGQPQYLPLDWSENSELPTDLESLVAVGGNNSRFMTLSSRGRVYDFTLDIAKGTIEIIQTFDLPDIAAGSNFEGFALARIQGKQVVAWAHRGEGEDPGILYWGELDLDRGKVFPVGRLEVRVPLPTGNPRHISDLKIEDTGRVWIGSATDPGDEGLFDSAVYTIGQFQIEGEAIAFQAEPTLTPTAIYPGHKIEAIEFLPHSQGDRIFGTDDENAGGFVRIDRFSEPVNRS
ncbi:MAG: hypothetical protein WBD58_06170 [Geitlerinemataceae cyanobacterium]